MKIFKRDGGGRVAVGDRSYAALNDITGGVRALKRPIPIAALKMDEPFKVETNEGTATGKAGDWVMQGVSGELYICAGPVFDASYDVVA
jgi:hypothetical protein